MIGSVYPCFTSPVAGKHGWDSNRARTTIRMTISVQMNKSLILVISLPPSAAGDVSTSENEILFRVNQFDFNYYK